MHTRITSRRDLTKGNMTLHYIKISVKFTDRSLDKSEIEFVVNKR